MVREGSVIIDAEDSEHRPIKKSSVVKKVY